MRENGVLPARGLPVQAEVFAINLGKSAGRSPCGGSKKQGDVGMKIAIVTGASSGIGKEVFTALPEHGGYDEVWAIARNEERLSALKQNYPFPVRTISLDLSREESIEILSEMLKEAQPEISFLANCSGYGKFEAVEKIPLQDSLGMVDLNCRALTALTMLALPYMKAGGEIMQIASVAAFQPVPYIAVYAASKAYVLSFSRALREELKPRKIKVTAVCPFWTKTAFFDRAVTKTEAGKEPVVKKYTAMYDPKKVVRRAFSDLKKGKGVSKYGFVARAQAAACKVLPHSLVMKIWLRQQKLNKKKD